MWAIFVRRRPIYRMEEINEEQDLLLRDVSFTRNTDMAVVISQSQNKSGSRSLSRTTTPAA
jgi:hypothetical protein